MPNTSPKYKLNSTDIKKIGKGALIAIGGAFLAYLAPIVTQIDYTFEIKGSMVDLTPIAVAFFSIIINAGQRWIADQR